MPPTPDLRFDIDALFAHLADNLDHGPDDEHEWHFSFRHDDADHLTRVGQVLAEEFDVYLQKEVETMEEDRAVIDPPLMAVVIQAVLLPDEVRSLTERFAALAGEEGLTYEGVSCHEPFDAEEAFGWLDLDEALLRLRNFTDSGLAPGEAVPFVFVIDTGGKPEALATVVAIEAAGFEGPEIVEDEEEPGVGVLIRVAGRNDEALLTTTYQEIERIAGDTGGELIGVQFFDDEAEDEDGEE